MTANYKTLEGFQYDLHQGMSIDEALTKHGLTLREAFLKLQYQQPHTFNSSEYEDRNRKAQNNQRVSKYIAKRPTGYLVMKTLNGKYCNFGTYATLEEAMKVRDELIVNGWKDLDEILDKLHIKRRNKGRVKHITKRKTGFNVAKTVNGQYMSFGIYETLNDAIKVRDKLIENNWQNLDEILNELGIQKRKRGRPKFKVNERTNEEYLEDIKETYQKHIKPLLDQGTCLTDACTKHGMGTGSYSRKYKEVRKLAIADGYQLRVDRSDRSERIHD